VSTLPYPAALLAAEVVKRYAGSATPALDGVTVQVAPGECVALVGESGSGKTTLLRCFNRMVEPDRGELRVRGNPVGAENPVALRRSMGYVQQEGGLLPHWTVQRNVELVPRLVASPDPGGNASRALDRVGLDPGEFGKRFPGSLSGGQRQRVALARALAAEPDILLLDEPFSALDALTRAELHRTFRSLLAGGNLTVLLVTHDLREAERLADRIGVIQEGRLLQVGPVAQLRAAPAHPYVEALLLEAEG
jgi:osmoprotectant transport system ATP-binding protein